MQKIPRLSTEQRENLVAYLDGELDERAAQEIEQVLARSEVARHEVNMLSRTWDVLGELPRVVASGTFTQNTVSQLQVLNAPRREFRTQPWFQNARRGGVFAGWAAALALSAWVGYSATNRWAPTEADMLLDDLPIIEQYDQLTEVGQIEFLRELRKHGTFNVQPTTPH